MKILLLSVLAIAMIGLMVPSVFADTEPELTTSVVTESIVNVLDIKANNVAIDEINSRVFLSFTFSSEITVIDSKTDKIIDKLTVGGYPINAIAVNPTTERLFVSYEFGRDGYIQIFNSKTLEPELSPLSIQRYPFDIAVNDSGNRLYVAENESSNLLIFEISENEIRLLETIKTPKWTIGVTIDEIKRIVSVSGASIQINDLDDYSHVSTISVKGQSFVTAIDPKLNQLYSINVEDGESLSIIDLNTNNVIKNISIGIGANGVAVDPETHRFYVSTQTSIEIFDGITNSKIHTFEVENGVQGKQEIEIDKNLQKAYVAKYFKTYVIDLECNCPEFFENYLNEIQEEENIKKEQQAIENQIYQIKQDWEHRTLLIFSEPPSQSQMLQLIGTEKKAKYEKLVLDLQSRNIQLSNPEDLLNSNQITSDERRLMLEMLEDFVFVFKTYFKDKVTELDDLVIGIEQEIENNDLSDSEKAQLIKDIRFDAEIKKNQMLVMFSEIIQPFEYTLSKEQSKQNIINEISMEPEPEPRESGGGCLIATAAFGSEMAPQVQFLREIRDNTVMTTQSGTAFMTGFNQFYYSFSPQIADYERENPVFKEAVKVTLTPLLTSLTLLNYVEIDTEEKMLGYGIGIILLNVGMYFVAPAVLIISLKKRFL